MEHDHYPHQLTFEGSCAVIVVACKGCRTAAFYKHPDTATGALVYHIQRCDRPDTILVELFPHGAIPDEYALSLGT